MDLKIGAYPSAYCYHRHNNTVQKHNNIAFCSSKQTVARNIGYALLASAMLTLSACTDKKQQPDKTEDETEMAWEGSNTTVINAPKTVYHYLPKDDIVANDNYDWLETVYPDGRVEKDSLGYQISVSPEGQRTVIKTETDSLGNTITITDYPDSTKTIKTDYQTKNINEILLTEQTFWANGNIKENKYYNEHPSDTADITSPTVAEQEITRFNENGILIYWETNCINPERNDSNNIYDNKGRIIYNDIKNEKYLYNGESETPFQSTSQYDDCLRITEYNSDGTIQKIYFKASDGTITEM